MGRKVMRVPMDFDAPLNEIWSGYLHSAALKEVQDKFPVKNCTECHTLHEHEDDFCQEEDTPYCIVYNSFWRNQWYYEPPTGPGYQLWETTTEGSPQSPVFATLEELAEWCEGNATTFADFTTTKAEWLKMFGKDCIYGKIEDDNKKLIFI
jgi:hypothetical protein